MEELFIFGAAASTMKFLLHWLSSGQTRPKRAELVGHVAQVKLYPVKSMRGIVLESGFCTNLGLKHPNAQLQDRSWMVTFGELDRFVTARQEPRLLLIQPSLHGEVLHLDLDSMPTLKLPLNPLNSKHTAKVIKVFGEEVECIDCGDEAADWISKALSNKTGHRLVYHNNNNPIRPAASKKRLPFIRDRQTKSSDLMMFQDDGPFHLATDASLKDLNERMDDPLKLETFRPTIYVTGVKKPFDEDSWKEVFIGDVKFTMMMWCARCILTTIDGQTAEVRSSAEPLNSLKKFRKVDSKRDSPCFGVYLVCDRMGEIHVNDPVYVIRDE